MNHYDRLAQVIRHLEVHSAKEPGRRELAHVLELSPSQLDGFFCEWGSMTPEDFSKCITAAHLRELLRKGKSFPDADPAAAIAAASPDEVQSSSLRIGFGFVQTPFGECLLARAARGICHLSFIDGTAHEAALAELRSVWPKAVLEQNDAAMAELVPRIFARAPGQPEDHPLDVFVRGSAFQMRVWEVLLRVPPGTLVTYGALAAAIGVAGAARAVGTAVGSNNVSWLIPCHRVVPGTAMIGGYRWGSARKRAMIAWETAPRVPSVSLISA